MHYVEDSLHWAPSSSEVKAFFKDHPCCIIDIETTGLAHKNRIILIGCIYLSELESSGSPIRMQWFNDDGRSEAEILNGLVTFFKKHPVHYIITFNGDAFDIPFINARLLHHAITQQLGKHKSIDVMKMAKARLKLPHYTLKDVERTLGIQRTDTISGRESVELYYRYLSAPTPEIKDLIMRHNREDISALPDILDALVAELPQMLPKMVLHVLPDAHIYMGRYQLKRDVLQMPLNYEAFTPPFPSLPDMHMAYPYGSFDFYSVKASGTCRLHTQTLTSPKGDTLTVISPEFWNKPQLESLNETERAVSIIRHNTYDYHDHIYTLTKLFLKRHIKKIQKNCD